MHRGRPARYQPLLDLTPGGGDFYGIASRRSPHSGRQLPGTLKSETAPGVSGGADPSGAMAGTSRWQRGLQGTASCSQRIIPMARNASLRPRRHPSGRQHLQPESFLRKICDASHRSPPPSRWAASPAPYFSYKSSGASSSSSRRGLQGMAG